MEGEIRLPVPVTVFGPLHLFALRVHRLADTGHGAEALAAADAYLAIAALARAHERCRRPARALEQLPGSP